MPEELLSDFSAIHEASRTDFRLREQERETIRTKLEMLLEELSSADNEFSKLSVFGAEELYRLARARLEIVGVLRSTERSANTEAENGLRAMESFITRTT